MKLSNQSKDGHSKSLGLVDFLSYLFGCNKVINVKGFHCIILTYVVVFT